VVSARASPVTVGATYAASVRAVVVGAGIGGLAAAIALERAGVEPIVLERAPELREAGFGLVISANAVTALGLLGLRDRVAQRGARVRRAEIRNPRGELLTLIDYDSHGWETYGILRAALQQAMLEPIPVERLRLNTACIGANEDGRALIDGAEPVAADIVVGADGINSAVRRSLFGEEPLRYGGHRAWRAGTSFDPERIGDRFVEVWGVGGGFGFGPAGQGRVYWYCFESVPEGAPAPERPREEFLRRYGAWFDPIPALIEATEPEAIESTFTYDRRPRRSWGRGRITLLGDAAHPMKPNIGQGAAQALEDAVVLGLCAADRRDPEAILREYERRRARRANAAVRASRRTGRTAEVRSRTAARLRDAVIKTLPDRLTVAQLRSLFEFQPQSPAAGSMTSSDAQAAHGPGRSSRG
jgi:2-polyprenyl-6-methoxyphenol hydroxylase-like FAD-dependent oxidoreductase